MPQSDKDPVHDLALARAVTELLDQTAREPISPRLRSLARQLEAALAQTRNSQADGQVDR